MGYSNSLTKYIANCSLILIGMVVVTAVQAQSAPGEGLGSIPADQYANDVERRAALANQATFDTLDPACNPGGVLDQIVDPSAPPPGADPQCIGDVFSIYLTVRELIHTANDLLGQGPNAASLRLDQQGLGTSLRWTAAEELAAQGSAASDFANSQLANLAARLNALRFGARGFTITGFNAIENDGEILVAGAYDTPRGGGASADGESFSAWGGFVNGSFGYGRKNDTDLENAFDFDGSEVTFGVDYRFRNNFVIGGVGGWKRQNIDFDEAASDIRVVDGEMEMDGLSGIVFGLYQADRFFASGSLGFETVDYDVERRIKYGSNNPDIGAANSTAFSTPTADLITATLNLGYAFHASRFTAEPYVNIEYKDITIDAFSEERSVDQIGNVDDDAFNLNIAEQTIESTLAMVGLRFQYTFTPSFGVIVPFARIESRNELSNDSRLIFAGYGALEGTNFEPGEGLLTFAVPTDSIDTSYYKWTVGFSAVIRGGRQRQLDGPITGGLMGYVQYESIEDLENYEQQVISAGIRYEF
jgi:uncharacterized protein YhjY with autotransporter beta-barrel domain